MFKKILREKQLVHKSLRSVAKRWKTPYFSGAYSLENKSIRKNSKTARGNSLVFENGQAA